MNVVIVEDEKRARDAIRSLLVNMEIPVRVVGEADNVRDAMGLIRRMLPDIVFVDIMLGEESGIEMIRCLKEKHVHTSYVMVSGYSDFRYAQQCIELGVAGYILKPVTYEDVEHFLYKIYGERKGTPLKLEVERRLQGLDSIKLECAGKNQLVKQVITYVDENMACSCRLSEVAREVKVSPEHLSRIFRKETDMMFTDYVKAIKMEYSMNLLRKTDKKINEIARVVGYENENYIYNIFTDFTGLTPNQYRKVEME